MSIYHGDNFTDPGVASVSDNIDTNLTVSDVVITTPANNNQLSPEILVAANAVGINEIYKIAMDNGAKGGKLLGAGGGGFMIFHVPSLDDIHNAKNKLKKTCPISYNNSEIILSIEYPSASAL